MTLLLVLGTNRFVKGIPGTVVGLVAGTAVAWVAQLPVETVASRFGAVPAGLPEFHIPAFRPSLILALLSPALTVAMLGAIESLMSAVVADRMSGDRHNPNVELVAQGVANIVSPMFGGLAGDGRHCPHGDQRSIGRAHACGRDDPRAHAARPCCSFGARWRDTFRWRCWRRSCSSSRPTWASGTRFRSCCGRPRPTSPSGW